MLRFPQGSTNMPPPHKNMSLQKCVCVVLPQGSMNLPPPENCGVPPEHAEMCILRVRRNHLMEDALAEISRQRSSDLSKPLRVHFIGEVGAVCRPPNFDA
jgi:hypothetical protein